MVNVFNIIVTGAMLVLGNDVNNPVPYCTVQLQQPATQEQYPDASVTLTVGGKSNNDI